MASLTQAALTAAGLTQASLSAADLAGSWYGPLSLTLMYDLRDLTAGAVASVSSTGSNTLALTQGTGSAQPTAVADSPYALGSELLTNGDFTSWTGDNPDGYVIIGTEDASNYVTQVAGAARIVSNGTLMGIYQNVLTATNRYLGGITVTAIPDTAIGYGAFVSDGADSDVSYLTATGTYTNIFTAGTGGTYYGVKRQSGVGAVDATVDDLFAKQITSEGMGLYFDGGDSLGAAPTLASLGVTDKVTLFDKVFISAIPTAEARISGNGALSGAAAGAGFALGINASGQVILVASDGSTLVSNSAASAITYGSHTLIGEIDLSANTMKVWDNDSLVINTTAGALASFNDVQDYDIGPALTSYSLFHGMKAGVLTADERATINAQ